MASQTFRDIYAHMPPPAETLAILVGTMELTVFGLGGLANPVEFAKGYGLPLLPATSKTQTAGPSEVSKADAKNDQQNSPGRRQEAWILSTVARNIQNGAVLLALGLYARDRRALGIAVSAGLITTVADAVIVQYYGVKEAVWGHVFGIVNSIAIGGSLLYWRREDKLW